MPHGGRRKSKMEELKNKLFLVAIGQMKVSDFEVWIFQDQYCLDNLDKEDLLIDILLVNFNQKDARTLLKTIYLNCYSEAEFYWKLIRWVSESIVENQSLENIRESLSVYDWNYTWESSYYLLDQLIEISWEFLSEYEIYDEEWSVKRLMRLCRAVQEQIDNPEFLMESGVNLYDTAPKVLEKPIASSLNREKENRSNLLARILKRIKK